MFTIVSGVLMFVAIVVVLVALILVARKFLVQSGDITIGVNGDPEKAMKCPAGGKLLNDLSEKGIFVSSACGGRGACGQCKVKVTQGGGNVLGILLPKVFIRNAAVHVKLLKVYSGLIDVHVLSFQKIGSAIDRLPTRIPGGISVPDVRHGGSPLRSIRHSSVIDREKTFP